MLSPDTIGLTGSRVDCPEERQPLSNSIVCEPSAKSPFSSRTTRDNCAIAWEASRVDSSVYAPSRALRYRDPPHPDRADIAKLIRAWCEILDVIGPFNEMGATECFGWLD